MQLHNAMWKNEKFSRQKNISLNQLFSNLFSKTVTFTKFLPKMRERISVISTMHCELPLFSLSWIIREIEVVFTEKL